FVVVFFFSSRRRHTRFSRDWSSDVCSSDLSCGDHVKTIEREIGNGLFDVVICNDNCNGRLPEEIEFVCLEDDLEKEYPIYSGNRSEERRVGKECRSWL